MRWGAVNHRRRAGAKRPAATVTVRCTMMRLTPGRTGMRFQGPGAIRGRKGAGTSLIADRACFVALAGGKRFLRTAPRLAPEMNARCRRRSSHWRTVWLSADCEMPSFAAAFAKLRPCATTTRARSSSGLLRCIYQVCL